VEFDERLGNEQLFAEVSKAASKNISLATKNRLLFG
jgi:hypothetical protein